MLKTTPEFTIQETGERRHSISSQSTNETARDSPLQLSPKPVEETSVDYSPTLIGEIEDKPKGVHFHNENQEWRASLGKGQSRKQKTYSCHKYGWEEARRLAIETRQEWERTGYIPSVTKKRRSRSPSLRRLSQTSLFAQPTKTKEGLPLKWNQSSAKPSVETSLETTCLVKSLSIPEQRNDLTIEDIEVVSKSKRKRSPAIIFTPDMAPQEATEMTVPSFKNENANRKKATANQKASGKKRGRPPAHQEPFGSSAIQQPILYSSATSHEIASWDELLTIDPTRGLYDASSGSDTYDHEEHHFSEEDTEALLTTILRKTETPLVEISPELINSKFLKDKLLQSATLMNEIIASTQDSTDEFLRKLEIALVPIGDCSDALQIWWYHSLKNNSIKYLNRLLRS